MSKKHSLGGLALKYTNKDAKFPLKTGVKNHNRVKPGFRGAGFSGTGHAQNHGYYGSGHRAGK